MNRKFATVMLMVLIALVMNSMGAAARPVDPVTGPAAPPITGPTSPQPPGPVGSGFTYQGQLKSSNVPVGGSCNMQFSLWDSAGNNTGQLGGIV